MPQAITQLCPATLRVIQSTRMSRGTLHEVLAVDASMPFSSSALSTRNFIQEVHHIYHEGLRSAFPHVCRQFAKCFWVLRFWVPTIASACDSHVLVALCLTGPGEPPILFRACESSLGSTLRECLVLAKHCSVDICGMCCRRRWWSSSSSTAMCRCTILPF